MNYARLMELMALSEPKYIDALPDDQVRARAHALAVALREQMERARNLESELLKAATAPNYLDAIAKKSGD